MAMGVEVEVATRAYPVEWFWPDAAPAAIPAITRAAAIHFMKALLQGPALRSAAVSMDTLYYHG